MYCEMLARVAQSGFVVSIIENISLTGQRPRQPPILDPALCRRGVE